jgi:hypothetical protein
MTDANDWAIKVRVMDKLTCGGRSLPRFDDPRVLVQRVTQSSILCGGPNELFSQLMPIYVPDKPEDEALRPIDKVYGLYDPGTESVHIFIRQIQRDASRYTWEPSTLTELVRIHEYAHAVVHLAIDLQDTEKELSQYGPSNETDWDSFRAQRIVAFSSLDAKSHELLAQAITWACLKENSNKAEIQTLTETFIALEAKQPLNYHLSSVVKQVAYYADWPLILKTAREGIGSYCENNFSMFEGLAALIEQTGMKRCRHRSDSSEV